MTILLGIIMSVLGMIFGFFLLTGVVYLFNFLMELFSSNSDDMFYEILHHAQVIGIFIGGVATGLIVFIVSLEEEIDYWEGIKELKRRMVKTE